MPKTLVWIHERGGFFGGAEQNIFATASHLQTFSHHLLYDQRGSTESPSFFAPFQSSHPLDFERPHRLFELLEEIRPALFFVHKCLSYPLLEALFRTGLPIVRAVHDHEIYCLRGSKSFPLTRTICTHRAGLCCLFPGLAFLKRDRETGRLAFSWPPYFARKKLVALDQRCSLFLAATRYMAEELERQGYPKERICILPLLTESRRGAPERSPLPGRIVYAGQLLRGKGLDCLIRSLRYIRSPFRLDIFGEGPEKRRCQELASAYPDVHFHGFLPHGKLQERLAEAAIGAVPSVWPEPFGAVGLEMMRCGLPIVAFDSGGIGEWLRDGENGYLIPHLQIEEMGLKLAYLLDNPKKAEEMGRRGLELLKQQFDFPTYIRRLEEELVKLLN